MKNIWILILLMAYLPATMNSQGIDFFDSSSWENVLAEARKSDKLIFFDAYTTWCGPCKMMSSRVFPQQEVGDFFNENFVNVKIDMEKGEGIELAKKYKVRAYPTLLFVNGDGELVHSSVGYRDAAELIELGVTALNPDTQFGRLVKRYESGDKNPDFLRKYALGLADAYDNNAEKVAGEYMATQNNWGTDENIEFISRFVGQTSDVKINDYFLENKNVFIEKLGKDYVDQMTMQLAFNEVRAKGKDLTDSEFYSVINNYFGEEKSAARTNLTLMYLSNTGQTDKAISVIKTDGYESAKGNPMALNQNAWYFYENATDKKDLKTALSWTEEGINVQKSYAILDTKAALLFKMGKTKKAMKAANEAIAFAKANGEEYDDTTGLINKWVTKK